MIESLRLQNFRGFEDHIVPFRNRTIVVGRNNAGKSTIVEALRLVSLVTRKYRNQNLRDAPPWLDNIPLIGVGISPSLTGFQLNGGPLHFQRREAPAVLTAKFTTGTSVTIYLGDHRGEIEMHALLRDSSKKLVQRNSQLRKLVLPLVSTMGSIGPLRSETRELDEQYVRNCIDTNRSSLHFRNQLSLLYDESFGEFKRIAELGWPSLQIIALEKDRSTLNPSKSKISLIVRDNDFSDEIDCMGHGLQVWLQMAWFLARNAEAECIVLDEPDVYMHPDVQRRLIRNLKSQAGRQLLVATHSTEIMAEVEPSDVLLVDRRERQSPFADTLPGLQQVVELLGSIHNISLARLSSSRLFLMLEGQDEQYLRRWHDTLFPHSHCPIGGLPRMSVGGWTGWSSAKGVGMMMRKVTDRTIKIYCLLDSDFHSGKEIDARYDEAKDSGVCLHIWRRKEIENYLVVPSTIQRLIERKSGKAVTIEAVEEAIRKACDDLRRATEEATVEAHMAEAKKWDREKFNAGLAATTAVKYIDREWSEGRAVDRVCGSELIAALSRWTSEKFNCSISAAALAAEMTLDEIAPEVSAFLTAIEQVSEIEP
ncbi:MAG: AAA family ATPase [Nibricoccus sp.]